MARKLFIVDKETHELIELDPNWRPPPIEAPYIRTDEMPAIQSNADNKFYDSKSKYYKSIRDLGLEIAGGTKRVADTPSVPWLQKGDDEYVRDLKKAKEMVQSGTAPLTERDRAICKSMNERLKNR